MDVFAQIRANRRRSAVLLVLVFLLLGVLGGVFGHVQGDPLAGVLVAGAAALVAVLVAWFAGPSLVLGVSGAREIQREDHPRLWNVVEEMSIAAGLPKPPRVFLIDDTAPNAFATGRGPSDGMVAITTGLLEKLDRDELQGVMAHELSHLRNYDVRYAMLVAVLVGAIALLCDLFLRGMRFRGLRGGGRGGRGNQGQALLLVAALLLAVVAPIAALALRMAISRRREYLADASGAELTRHPAALARALEKIAKDPEPLEAANRATQHLYVVNPLRTRGDLGAALFATHPPTQDRIKRLLEMGYENAGAARAARGATGA